jgi:deoxyribonuclease-4
MKYIGAHVSIGGGIFNAPHNARDIDANAYALFLKNQKRWNAAAYKDEAVWEFKKLNEQYNFDANQILPHDSYLINLGNFDKEKREKSKNAFLDEFQRCEQLGLKKVNFHPGATLKKISDEDCIKYIADGINEVLDKTNFAKAVIENTAGQGSALGYRFEQLKQIIELVEKQDRIGVCIDTAHMFAAGYDIRTKDAFDITWKEFANIVGFEKLMGMHINDSKKDLGTRVDRHESLGKGLIGIDAFKFLMEDERFDNIPLILETPNPEIWKDEISLLRSFIK